MPVTINVSATLQGIYDNDSGIIDLNPTQGLMAFRDDGTTPLGGPLLATQNAAGTQSYFASSAKGVEVGVTDDEGGTDAAIKITRTLDSNGNNGHGFSDQTVFDRASLAYAAYDVLVNTGAAANNYNHIAAFQARHSMDGSGNLGTSYSFYDAFHVNNGTTTNHYGLLSAPVVVAGKKIINRYGIRINDFAGNNADVSINYGLYIASLRSQFTANRYAIYIESTKSYFGGQIGVGVTTPAPSAALEISSTTQGFLAPRMTTTQRNAISSPAEGLVVYNTTTQKLNVYTTTWEAVTSA